MVVRSDSELALPETVPGEDRSIELDEGASFSGHERNHLFLNRGDRFADVSTVSGADAIADSRSFAILDYDRDGWPDLAVVSANAPLLQLFRNEIAPLMAEGRGNAVAIRMVGGNKDAVPSKTWTARDGFGAKIRLEVGDRTLVREHQCGEGMAAQNSATVLVGIGEALGVDAIEVDWPSGRHTRTVDRVPAGSFITAYEDPSDSPTGSAFDVHPYRPDNSPSRPTRIETKPRTLSLDVSRRRTGARINMYTTMATWCATCRFELPHLELLRNEFSYQELAMIGVPTDPNDQGSKLREYVERYAPPYGLLIDLAQADRAAVNELVTDGLGAELLPATILTDTQGNVIDVLAGSPDVSDLRKLLHEVSTDPVD